MRLGPGAHEFPQDPAQGVGGPALHDCSDSLRFSHLAFLRLVVSLGDRQLPGEAMIAGGSWTVLDGHGREIGRVEGDEFVRCGTRLIYRIEGDRKSTRLNSSHSQISYAVFCLKKKKKHAYC